MEEISKRIINLCYALDKLSGEGSLVDSYFGDYIPELSNKKISHNWVLAEINELRSELSKVPIHNFVRVELEDILTSLETFLTNIITPNNSENYIKVLEKLYGTQVYHIEYSTFKSRIDELQNILELAGYKNPWPESIKGWLKNTEISSEDYLDVLKENVEIFKELTFKHVLPNINIDQTDFEKLLDRLSFKLVDTNESWSAFNVYAGNFTSEIQINKNSEFNKYFASIFACHEVFPGHYFDLAIKEYLYKASELPLYSTINLLYTPSSVIAEGIADYGRYFFEFPFSIDEQIAYLYDRLKMDFRHVLATRIHLNEIEENEAIDKLNIELGVGLEESQRMIKFANKWKFYFPTYTQGFYSVKNNYSHYNKSFYQHLYTSLSLKSFKLKLNS